MLLFIDNVDSFTYNLVQYFQILKVHVKVIRNDELSIQGCLALNPIALVIGPGPSTPSRAGISNGMIAACMGKIPILGVCLGHQCIAEVFGGQVIRANRPMHGKTSQIFHDQKGVFSNLSSPMTAMRYHSLIVEKQSLPSVLNVSAETEDGEIMGIRHCNHQIEGVQFHPESICTPEGLNMLKNFIQTF
jgi:anthranilate synthase/aminodeoxychorismate synthase-like glutamine amidotransferase